MQQPAIQQPVLPHERHSSSRRRFLQAAGALALALGHPGSPRAATDLPRVPIADAHSHFGLLAADFPAPPLVSQMAAAGLMLLSWNIVGDGRWTTRNRTGIAQRATPGRGEQSRYVAQRLDAMRRYLASTGLAHVQKATDIDAARAGTPHVVIAVEGAGFTEDGLDNLERFHAQGLRHLQLVHYIRNGLGDFQTESPDHDGLTALGAEVIRACNRLGVLVDLAHATNPVIDRALEVSATPLIWSHSALTGTSYDWRRSSALSRKLHLDYARKIARRGGAVGLWALRSSVQDSPAGYADELLRMVDAIGAEHVMFGTDIDGLGTLGVMSRPADLRAVADLLQARGVDEKTLRALCFENYARCLRAAIEAGRGA